MSNENNILSRVLLLSYSRYYASMFYMVLSYRVDKDMTDVCWKWKKEYSTFFCGSQL